MSTSTNVQKSQNRGPDPLDVLLKAVWIMVTKASAFTVWAVISVLMLHPWRGTDWSALFTVLLPVLVVLTIASFWVRFLRYLLPWGDLHRGQNQRQPKVSIDKELDPEDRKIAKVLARNWPAAAVAARIGQVTTDPKGRETIVCPTMVRVEPSPLGMAFVVKPVPGQTVAEVIDAAARLETGWTGGREIRAERLNPGTFVRYTLVLSDPLEGTRNAQIDAPQGWLE